MFLPSDYYIDPVDGDDSTGDGSIGNPWQTVQHALDTITKDTTNGDRINIKSTGDDILTAALSLTTYGSTSAGLTFQGYDSIAGDGGQGGIDGDGSFSIITGGGSGQTIIFADLHLHNSGSSTIVNVSNGTDLTLLNCEINGTSGNVVGSVVGIKVINCNIYEIGGSICTSTPSIVKFNYFKNGSTNKFTAVIDDSNSTISSSISHNIFSLDGISAAILANNRPDTRIFHNTFYTIGSGTGIASSSSQFGLGNFIVDNIFEGWSVSIDMNTTDNKSARIQNNSFFNDCSEDTIFLNSDVFQINNELLDSSPLTKSGSDTYENRAVYFKPVDVGNIFDDTIWRMGGARGAVQLNNRAFSRFVFRPRVKKAMAFLREDTAVTIKLGPFVDSSDGNTEETALTITQADILLSKNGGAFAQKNESSNSAHDADGYYNCALDITDVNTAGILVVQSHPAGALLVERQYQVMPSGIYDAMFGAPADLFERTADTVLSRNVSNVEDTLEEHTLGTLILGALEFQASGSTGLYVYKTDGVTEHLIKLVTVDPTANLVVKME